MNKQVNKIAKFFDKEIKDAMQILIVAVPTGYELFGRFRIESSNSYFYVSDIRYKDRIELSSLKLAVTWCVLANVGNHYQSRRLQLLDLKLSSLNTDTAIHRKMLKAASTADDKLLYKIKLQEDFYKRRMIVNEIDTHIKNSRTLHNAKMTPKKQRIFKYQ
jgi:hypothetical protein